MELAAVQHWLLADAGSRRPFAPVLTEPEALLHALKHRVSGKPEGDTRVYRVPVDGAVCFVKLYLEPSGFQCLYKRPRGWMEWRNLARLKQLGVSVPEPLLYGSIRDAQGQRWSVLVTQAVEGAVDLAQLMHLNPEYFADRHWFRALVISLGTQVRRMHDAGFAHNDLNWRNVLVSPEPEPRTWIFDCPRGRRWFGPFRRYRVVKDLTHLDKLGRRWLSRSQRLLFFQAYCGHAVLTKADRRLLRRVLARPVHDKYQPSGD